MFVLFRFVYIIIYCEMNIISVVLGKFDVKVLFNLMIFWIVGCIIVWLIGLYNLECGLILNWIVFKYDWIG